MKRLELSIKSLDNLSFKTRYKEAEGTLITTITFDCAIPVAYHGTLAQLSMTGILNCTIFSPQLMMDTESETPQ